MGNKLRQLDKSWIGVDLDRTLAHYDGWKRDPETGIGRIGAPIPAMVERVKRWLAEGETVKIFTARMCGERVGLMRERTQAAIEQWCAAHLGAVLEVTAEKDFHMKALYDDLAIGVEPNTGRLLSPEYTRS
jgi:hypothetical protein